MRRIVRCIAVVLCALGSHTGVSAATIALNYGTDTSLLRSGLALGFGEYVYDFSVPANQTAVSGTISALSVEDTGGMRSGFELQRARLYDGLGGIGQLLGEISLSLVTKVECESGFLFNNCTNPFTNRSVSGGFSSVSVPDTDFSLVFEGIGYRVPSISGTIRPFLDDAGGSPVGPPGPAPVPEPGTYALMLIGLAAVFVAGRRRTRALGLRVR